jgi:2-C-methyl-D-erythritol 2,4-cyclodiphosphate synthase
MSFRIGLGKDSHRFAKESPGSKTLIIGGVEFPGHPAFVAHSDGDVLYHAVFNAIASALGLHSIGHYFPNSAEREAGRNSAEYLEYARSLCEESNYRLANLSLTVECREPKIDQAAAAMKSNLARILGIGPDQIGITATSGENASVWGQGLGVEVTATVLVQNTALVQKKTAL